MRNELLNTAKTQKTYARKKVVGKVGKVGKEINKSLYINTLRKKALPTCTLILPTCFEKNASKNSE